jgi:spore coat polysaccharide biosynthesis protein SpsF
VLERFGQGDCDYACNVLPPTFPDGLDTEVFSFQALECAWKEARLASEREHVTPYIWSRPEKFRLVNITHSVDLSGYRWTVDEPRDLEFVRAVYARLGKSGEMPFGMGDVLRLLAGEPHLRELNHGIRRNEGYALSVKQEDRPE